MSHNYKKASILHDLEQAIKKKVVEKSKAKENYRNVYHASQDKRRSHNKYQEQPPKVFNPQNKNERPISLFNNQNLKNLQNKDSSKGHNASRKANPKKVQKLISLINYTVKSADKLVKYINLSNFQAEFAVKLYSSDKENLLNEAKKISIEEAMLQSQRSDVRCDHGNIANYQSLQQENMRLKKEIKTMKDRSELTQETTNQFYEKLSMKYSQSIEQLNSRKIRQRLSNIVKKEVELELCLTNDKYKEDNLSREDAEELLEELIQEKTQIYQENHHGLGAYEETQWKQIKEYIENHLVEEGFKADDTHYKVLVKQISCLPLSASIKNSETKKTKRFEQQQQKIKQIKLEKQDLIKQIKGMKDNLSALNTFNQLKGEKEELSNMINVMKQKMKKMVLSIYDEDTDSKKQLQEKFNQIQSLPIRQQLGYLYEMVKYSLKDYKDLQVEFENFVRKAQEGEEELQNMKIQIKEQEQHFNDKISKLTSINKVCESECQGSETSCYIQEPKDREIKLLEQQLSYKQKQCKRLQSQLKQFYQANSESSQKLKLAEQQWKQKLSAMSDQVYSLQSKNNDNVIEISSWNNKCEELVKQHEKILTENKEKHEMIVKLQNKVGLLEEEISNYQQQVQELNGGNVEMLQAEVKRLQTELQNCQDQLNKKTQQLSTMGSQNRQLTNVINNRNQEIQQLEQINRQKIVSIQKLEEQISLINLDEYTEKISSLERKVGQLQAVVAEKDEEIDNIEEQTNQEIANKINKLQQITQKYALLSDTLKYNQQKYKQLEKQRDTLIQQIEGLTRAKSEEQNEMKESVENLEKWHNQLINTMKIEYQGKQKKYEAIIQNKDNLAIQLEKQIQKLELKNCQLSNQLQGTVNSQQEHHMHDKQQYDDIVLKLQQKQQQIRMHKQRAEQADETVEKHGEEIKVLCDNIKIKQWQLLNMQKQLEKKVSQIGDLQKEHQEAMEQNREKTREIESVRLTIEQLEEKTRSMESDRIKQNKVYTQLQQQLKQKAQEVSSLLQNIIKLQKQKGGLSLQLKSLSQELSQIKSNAEQNKQCAVSQLQNKIQLMDEQYQQITGQFTNIQQLKQLSQQEIVLYKEQLKSLKEELKTSQRNWQTSEQEIDTITKQLHKVNQQYRGYEKSQQAKLSDLNHQIDILTNQLETVRLQYQKYKQSQSDQLSTLNNQMDAIAEQLEKTKQENSMYQSFQKSLEAQVQNLNKQIDTITSELDKVKLQSSRSQQSQQGQVSNLNRQIEVNQLKQKQYCNLIKRILRATIDLDELLESQEQDINCLGIQCLLERGAKKAMQFRKKQRQLQSQQKKNKYKNGYCYNCHGFGQSNEDFSAIELPLHRDLNANNDVDQQFLSINLHDSKGQVCSMKQNSEVQPFILDENKQQKIDNVSKSRQQWANLDLKDINRKGTQCQSDRIIIKQVSKQKEHIEINHTGTVDADFENQEDQRQGDPQHEENREQNQCQQLQGEQQEKEDQKGHGDQQCSGDQQQQKDKYQQQQENCNFDEFNDVVSQRSMSQSMCSINQPQQILRGQQTQPEYQLEQSKKHQQQFDLGDFDNDQQSLESSIVSKQNIEDKGNEEHIMNNNDIDDFGDIQSTNNLDTSIISKQDDPNIDEFGDFAINNSEPNGSMLSIDPEKQTKNNLDDFNDFEANSLSSSLISDQQLSSENKESPGIDFNQFKDQSSDLSSSMVSQTNQ